MTPVITVAAIAFAVNVLTTVLKRWVFPTFGKTGIQVVAFGLAVLGAAYYSYAQNFPGLTEFVTAAVALFSLAVTLYEVIWSRISWFKGETEVE